MGIDAAVSIQHLPLRKITRPAKLGSWSQACLTRTAQRGEPRRAGSEDGRGKCGEASSPFARTTGRRSMRGAGCPRVAHGAIVQIAHGLAEHSARYARLAAALNAAGYGGLRQRPSRPRASSGRRRPRPFRRRGTDGTRWSATSGP